jgi:hypothetical protein
MSNVKPELSWYQVGKPFVGSIGPKRASCAMAGKLATVSIASIITIAVRSARLGVVDCEDRA